MRMREKNVFPSGNLHLCNEQRVELTSRAQNALTPAAEAYYPSFTVAPWLQSEEATFGAHGRLQPQA